MAEITAAAVGKLREMTNAGMMDCKKALTEAKGDLAAAVDILRKRGVATAAKKATREAGEGIIVQHIQPGARVGLLAATRRQGTVAASGEAVRGVRLALAVPHEVDRGRRHHTPRRDATSDQPLTRVM